MAQVKEKKTTLAANGSSNGLKTSTYHQWYETMLRIRRFEERALKMYSINKIRGFLHVYIGQEAIAAAITTALRPTDPIVTAYRQHGIALSRGVTSKACMAELFGKETGVNKGKGGSMHFFSKEHHYFGGNGIVGAQIPIGTGIAFAEKYRSTDNICLTMFGEGAARQGALHEAFNMAMLWKLPVLYICENNFYAMGTSVTRSSNVTDMYKLGLSYEMPSSAVDGMDVMKTHEALSEAAAYVRSGKGPYLLEIKTYRYRGHSVSDPAKYRSAEELENYKEKDPIDHLKAYIEEHKLLKISELEAIDKAILKEIDDAEAFAEDSKFPPASELYTDNYVQEDYPYIRD
ncbi:MAG: pyruvate dehydrogenase (acetyl-transferring) E1 component subunit alpha [Saprospiraceae bacterium]|uniref:Pyruvate dehydrogenase E1 component subunit alpha n=1 Tax=Candidatus Opimibacter skivensis TaxID=2982028 RepID=A0A9D7SST9_9BACT|nr:pyruvate dehydrogenase (acetyl-transferring) E1 component subunit alpha [Candidatus Opimibacter skivensis]